MQNMRKHSWCGALVLVIVLWWAAPNQVQATGFVFNPDSNTFTAIDVPGAPYTWANGINDAGQIVGFYPYSTVGHAHGFLDSGGSFTPIDVPGARNTWASGINTGGQIVGSDVPEPSSLLLLGCGLLGLAAWRWKQAA